MFRKRRSAHGIFSSPNYPVISAPTNFVKVSGMGSLGEAPSATANTANSVTTDPALSDIDDGIGDGGAVGEPLVQDVEQMQSHHDASINEPPQTPPPIKAIDFQPLKSHPVASSPSEEDSAPPPPDFTRRGIHIPTRTR